MGGGGGSVGRLVGGGSLQAKPFRLGAGAEPLADDFSILGVEGGSVFADTGEEAELKQKIRDVNSEFSILSTKLWRCFQQKVNMIEHFDSTDEILYLL